MPDVITLPVSADPQFLELLNLLVPEAAANLARAGRPNVQDWKSARYWHAAMTERGEKMLLIAMGKGELHRFIPLLAVSLAILAHQPGGVDLFGQHFEVTK